MELSRQALAASRRRAVEARPHRLRGREPAKDRRVLFQGARLPRLRLDRRFLCLHALQYRPSHREFHSRLECENAPHGIRAERLYPFAEFVRPVRAEEDPDHLATAAPWPGQKHRNLSPQSGQSGDRTVLRARSDERRGAWLFRATAVAPGHPAATEDLASGQDHGLGPFAAAGFQSIGVRRWRRARRTTCGWSRSRVILRWPRRRPSKDDLALSSSDPMSGVGRACLSNASSILAFCDCQFDTCPSALSRAASIAARWTWLMLPLGIMTCRTRPVMSELSITSPPHDQRVTPDDSFD